MPYYPGYTHTSARSRFCPWLVQHRTCFIKQVVHRKAATMPVGCVRRARSRWVQGGLAGTTPLSDNHYE